MKYTAGYLKSCKKRRRSPISNRVATYIAGIGFYGIPVTSWCSPPNGPPSSTY